MSGADLANLLNEASSSKFSGIIGVGDKNSWLARPPDGYIKMSKY